MAEAEYDEEQQQEKYIHDSAAEGNPPIQDADEQGEQAGEEQHRRPPGPAEEQGDGRDYEAQRGEEPEQAEEAHAESADLPPAGEQGGLIGQGWELSQGPESEETHEVDQAMEENEQRQEDGKEADHIRFSRIGSLRGADEQVDQGMEAGDQG